MLSPRHFSLDQLRGAQRVKDREAERTLNEASLTRPGVAATTSTNPANGGYTFSGPLGSLPGVYGTILG
jgi:hypothetical protein